MSYFYQNKLNRSSRLTVAALAMFAASLPAFGQSEAPRLEPVRVIPFSVSSGVSASPSASSVSAQSAQVDVAISAQPSQASDTTPVISEVAVTSVEPSQAPLPALSMSAVQQQPSRASIRSEQQDQMIYEMRTAVQQVANNYGNPYFAQVFTNDPMQAQLMRKRIQTLQNIDVIKNEIAALESQKAQTKQEAENARRELSALQEQINAMNARLMKARSALSTN